MSTNRLVELGARFVFLRRLGPRWAKPLAKGGVWRLPSASLDSSGCLIVPELGVPIPRPDAIGLAVLGKIRYACDLHRRAGANWTFESDSAIVDVDGVRIRILNEADIQVVHEVFGERFYTCNLPGHFLILDIGANIGASMLFFARHYDADVWGYELVPSTAEIAAANVALNPDLAPRITLAAFGLGESDRELELECDPNLRPSNSIFPAPGGAPTPEKSLNAVVEKVFVKDVVPEVERALAELGNRKLVVKLDAEGAEFGILRRLASTGLLARIDLFLLEWHRLPNESVAEIPKMLTDHGFLWFSREHPDAPVGFITAFRAPV